MQLSPSEVERIVQEVVRRLASERSTLAHVAETSSNDISTLVLNGRVVTLAQFDGKLDGVKQVVVRKDAVVTPAVKDELSNRGVSLLRERTPDRTGGSRFKNIRVDM